jgi:hypothetical protein
VEPFWGLYQQHQKGEIRELLEGMRIGRLKGYQEGAQQKAFKDPFANEPKRCVHARACACVCVCVCVCACVRACVQKSV